MRVGIDANLSSRLANALGALFSDSAVSSAPIFQPVGIGPATSDVLWLSDFAASGGNAIIGQDRRILSRPHEVQALNDAHLHACLFDFGQSGAKGYFQAASIIHWWPRLHQVWSMSVVPVILRVKPTNSLNWNGLEELRYELEDGVPRVRHAAYIDPA